jgi:succinyl-CoA synthetase beta subunit
MARIPLSEYRAKKLLLGDAYTGIQITTEKKFTKKGAWVVKVDQGVKKRFKQGLVAIDVTPAAASVKISAWRKLGFTQFIVEPYCAHAPGDEQYISLERVREGIRILHTKAGGVDIESQPNRVAVVTVFSEKACIEWAHTQLLPHTFVQKLYEVFESAHCSFIEINPFVVRDDRVELLDAALLVDSAAESLVRGLWSMKDTVQPRAGSPEEERVRALAATTPAALSLNVLNKNGALFFLLSGGGGSIVIADEVAARGAAGLIGNYGEYSGGPTREETHLYSREVLGVLLTSKAPRKALVIAGGVANFTDVKLTFAGIVDALAEVADRLRAQQVQVFVRRGGPNERAGLEHMKTFLEVERLLGSVYGSDVLITQAATDALHYIQH